MRVYSKRSNFCCGLNEVGSVSPYHGDPDQQVVLSSICEPPVPWYELLKKFISFINQVWSDPYDRGLMFATTTEDQVDMPRLLAHADFIPMCTFINPQTDNEVTLWVTGKEDMKILTAAQRRKMRAGWVNRSTGQQL